MKTHFIILDYSLYANVMAAKHKVACYVYSKYDSYFRISDIKELDFL